MKKVYILDTNVLLYDYTSIFSFGEHDVIIPIIALEELDRFKKGNSSLNLSAREFSRQLDKLSKKSKADTNNIPLGKGKGTLSIAIDNFIPELPTNLFPETADNRILALANNLTNSPSSSKPQYILVTKDINLRMKARALSIKAEDYEGNKIKDLTDLYTGYRYETVSHEIISELFGKNEIPPDFLNNNPMPNEYFILKNTTQSALAVYKANKNKLILIENKSVSTLTPKNVEQIFAAHALTDPEIQLVTITGKAGTGKTLLTIAAALEQKKHFKQIYLYKPVATLGKALGFLPGSLEEKLDPYTDSFKDSLEYLKDKKEKDKDKDDLLVSKKIVMAAMPYLRGRSLPHIFMYADEVQNITPHEIKTFLTRAGEKTKVVLTGDIYQIDTPYLDSQSNGLTYLIDKMKGQEIYAHVNLLKGERSHLAELAANLL